MPKSSSKSKKAVKIEKQLSKVVDSPLLDKNKQFSAFGGFGPNQLSPLIEASIGYEAVQSTGKRKVPGARSYSEDWELRGMQRRSLITDVRDLYRNYSVVQWAIQTHLDWTTSWRYFPNTGDAGLDRTLEEFYDWWSQAENCDISARHSLQEQMRIWELARICDGDILINQVKGGLLQSIEGDRIQSWGGAPYGAMGINSDWVINGVYCNEQFKPLSYMIYKRQPQGTTLEFDKALSAKWATLYAVYWRFDQVRGISPFAPAANNVRDLQEANQYALLKMKVSQMYAAAIQRKDATASTQDLTGMPPSPGNPPDGGLPPGQLQNPGYSSGYAAMAEAFMTARGPMFFDLDDGDEMKILESTNPSTEFLAYSNFETQLVLKGLDIPMSFYNEAWTNYSGSTLAQERYLSAKKIQRQKLRNMLKKLTSWRIQMAVDEGLLKSSPKLEGLIIHDFVHAGAPIYDRVKETTSDVAGVNAGFDDPISVCHRRGLNFFQVIDNRSRAEAYAKQQGVILATALPSIIMLDPAQPKNIKESAGEEALGEAEDKDVNDKDVKNPDNPKSEDQD